MKMYSPFTIGNKCIFNRLVASAMFEYGATNGKMSEKIYNRYEKLAKGGAGLIITGMHGVSASASVAPIMVNTEYEGYIEDMRKLAQIVHKENSAIFIQLQHCGAKTSKTEDYDKFTVSDLYVDDYFYHEASKEELQKVIKDFSRSALYCKEAGIDGVQIHAAHGFLLNSFLSPSTNKRIDEYGKKRAHLLFEIYEAIRQTVGKDFAVGVKFPFSDLKKNSITPEESISICNELEKRGIDFIEVSAGMVMDSSSSSFIPLIRNDKQAPFLRYAAKLAEEITVPVISVCGYRTPEMVEKALEETKISAVAFGRPLVCEPNLPLRWKEDTSPAKCLSCNACVNSFVDGIITCQVKKSQE